MLGAGLLGHGDELDGRRAADDGVVDEQHVLALEFARHRVELLTHAALAGRLTRHDECPSDVAVLVEPLAVFDAELARDLHRGGPG